MNALDVLRVLKRHPVVLTILLAVTLGGVFAVYQTLPVTYQNTTAVALLAPNKTLNDLGQPEKVNPLQVAGSSSAELAASGLVLVANSTAFERQLKRAGVTSAVTVISDPDGGGIVLDVTTASQSRATANADLPKVTSALTAWLRDQQVGLGAPKRTMFTLHALTDAGPATRVSSGRLKTSAVAGVVGILVSIGLVLLYDGRQRRRAATPALTRPPNGAGARGAARRGADRPSDGPPGRPGRGNGRTRPVPGAARTRLGGARDRRTPAVPDKLPG